MGKGFTQVPDDVLEELYSRKLSPLHFQIMLYVARKTYGFSKPNGDIIAISKMADDIGRWREKVSRAVKDLEFMGMLEVTRTGSKKGHEIRIRSVKDWDETVTKTSHVSKTSHVTKSSREPYRKRHANRDENVTHNIHITNTLQYTPPISPIEVDDEEGEAWPDGFFDEAEAN